MEEGKEEINEIPGQPKVELLDTSTYIDDNPTVKEEVKIEPEATLPEDVKTLKDFFGKCVAAYTRKIKKVGTSGAVYVPKEYIMKKYTALVLIIDNTTVQKNG